MMFGNILLFVGIGVVIYMMMKGGGCCGSSLWDEKTGADDCKQPSWQNVLLLLGTVPESFQPEPEQVCRNTVKIKTTLYSLS